MNCLSEVASHFGQKGASLERLAEQSGGTKRVNGAAATQPGRKLRAGDRFGLVGGPEWTITR